MYILTFNFFCQNAVKSDVKVNVKLSIGKLVLLSPADHIVVIMLTKRESFLLFFVLMVGGCIAWIACFLVASKHTHEPSSSMFKER